MNTPIGLFGGTFDPIHLGHLRLAEELGAATGCAEVRFIPAGTPPHRAAPVATPAQRQAMIKLAIADNPRFVLDPRELTRTDPCYAIQTLEAIRQDVGVNTPLVFMIGADAFLGLPSWQRWTELLNFAHFAVAHRPGFGLNDTDLPAELRALYQRAARHDPATLASAPAGMICHVSITPLGIAARDLRAACGCGASVRYLVPEAVRDYLTREALYTRAP